MAKVKYDVSGAEPRQFEVPKPGVYDAIIKEMSHGDSSSGNPMFTIVFQITKGDNKDARIWYYILTDGSQEWRLREFTDALGLKPKGELDTDKLVNSAVQIRTAIDPARDGYDEKARIKNVLPAAGGAAAGGEGDEEEEPYTEWSLEDLREEAEARELKIEGRKTKDKLVKALEADDEAAEGEEEPEAKAEADDEEELTREDLNDMSREELKTLIKEEELEIRVTRSLKDDALRDKIAEALELGEEEEEGEEEGEEEEGEEELTRADLEKMDRTELKQLIKDEKLEVKVLRSTKDDQLREKIAEALELGEDEEEEAPAKEEEEEDTNYEEWEVSELKDELKERGLKTDGRKSILVGRLKKDDESGEEPF